MWPWITNKKNDKNTVRWTRTPVWAISMEKEKEREFWFLFFFMLCVAQLYAFATKNSIVHVFNIFHEIFNENEKKWVQHDWKWKDSHRAKHTTHSSIHQCNKLYSHVFENKTKKKIAATVWFLCARIIFCRIVFSCWDKMRSYVRNMLVALYSRTHSHTNTQTGVHKLREYTPAKWIATEICIHMTFSLHYTKFQFQLHTLNSVSLVVYSMQGSFHE